MAIDRFGRCLKLHAATRFTYVYDLGDEWRHECEVEGVDVDPELGLRYGSGQAHPVLGMGHHS